MIGMKSFLVSYSSCFYEFCCVQNGGYFIETLQANAHTQMKKLCRNKKVFFYVAGEQE